MDRLTDWIIPGNSAVIYKDGKKVFEYSAGYSDLENKIKMTGGEYLNIYSCSKPTTVTAAMQLYEKGSFLLDDPLYEFIPEFKEMYLKDGTKAKNPITIRQLFTMTAGFNYDLGCDALKRAKQLTNGRTDTLTAVKCLAEEPLEFEPGERWNYSLCHDVLAAVVEVISGKRFSEYVKENIFDRLDMKNSFYHATEDIKAKMAQQYRYEVEETDAVKLQSGTFGGGRVVNAGKDNGFILGSEYDSSGAGIITTVPDYAKFAAAMANKGTGLNGERILNARTIELMKINQLNDRTAPYFDWQQLKGWGYGLGVRTLTDKAASGCLGNIGSFGWGGAAGANIIMDTEENLAVFYAHHMLNPQEPYYQPRLINAAYLDLQ